MGATVPRIPPGSALTGLALAALRGGDDIEGSAASPTRAGGTASVAAVRPYDEAAGPAGWR